MKNQQFNSVQLFIALCIAGGLFGVEQVAAKGDLEQARKQERQRIKDKMLKAGMKEEDREKIIL